MATEEMADVITLNDPSAFSEDFSAFYLKRKFSDITFIIDGQKIFAHKVILAARSVYFSSLLDYHLSESEIVIQDVSRRVFQKVLKYLYTGSISIEASKTGIIFDVLLLANKYCLDKLEVGLSEKVTSVINMDNVFDILNKANEVEMQGLRDVCHTFLDNHSLEILENDHLNKLTQKSMVNLLIRDSFPAPEIDIFRSVAKWCENNKDENNLVIQCVRLSCLTNEEILSTVYPSKLIEDQKLLAIMAGRVDGKRKSLNSRVLLIKDENLATPEYNAEVISGKNTNFLLNGTKDVGKCAYHFMDEKDGITVKLGAPCYVNHIHMRLLDVKKRCYKYYVEVSLDLKNWRKIIDYSRYDCRSVQNLYFDQVLVRYVRIVGTSFVNKVFHLVFFEIYLKSDTPTVNADGIIFPTENVATTDKGAAVIEGNNGYAFASCATQSSAIIVQLAQPYILSSLKFLLDSKFRYKYRVETSVDKCNWQTLVDYNTYDYVSWQYLDFGERPVIYIKLTGSGLSSTNSAAQSVLFKCASLECPSSSNKKSSVLGF